MDSILGGDHCEQETVGQEASLSRVTISGLEEGFSTFLSQSMSIAYQVISNRLIPQKMSSKKHERICKPNVKFYL